MAEEEEEITSTSSFATGVGSTFFALFSYPIQSTTS